MPSLGTDHAARVSASTEMRCAALSYVDEGFRVTPLRRAGKRPITAHGLKDATADPRRISRYWGRDPEPNIGVLTDGLVVVDFDPKRGGLESLAQLEAEHGPFTTRRHLTGEHGDARGVHLVFRQNGQEVRNAVGVMPGVDIRADGGYIVAPPSLHSSGVRYEVAHDGPIETVPAVLEDLVRPTRPNATAGSRHGPSGGLTGDVGATEGSRNDSLARAAGRLALACDDPATHLQLVRAVNATFDPPLDDAEVARTAESIWRREAAKGFDPERPSAEALHELRRQRERQWAVAQLRQEQQDSEFTVPPSTTTLADELAIADGPLTFSIDRLHPIGANALLAAQFKAGKTTLMLNHLRALADGRPFLGSFDTHLDGRVAFWNYELTDRQFRAWLRRLGIKRPERAAVLNLRGYRMPLAAPAVADFAVEWLQRAEVRTWVLDPWARVFSGSGDENSNTDVGAFLEAIDVIKRRAGVQDLVLTTHTGRKEHTDGAEHARGATRLDDWADVRWLLTREGDHRFFRANGRDVDIAESRLTYNPSTLTLTLAGDGLSRRESRVADLVDVVVEAVRTDPGVGTKDLLAKVGGRSSDVTAALRAAEQRGLIEVEHVGTKHSHRLAEETPS